MLHRQKKNNILGKHVSNLIFYFTNPAPSSPSPDLSTSSEIYLPFDSQTDVDQAVHASILCLPSSLAKPPSLSHGGEAGVAGCSRARWHWLPAMAVEAPLSTGTTISWSRRSCSPVRAAGCGQLHGPCVATPRAHATPPTQSRWALRDGARAGWTPMPLRATTSSEPEVAAGPPAVNPHHDIVALLSFCSATGE